MADDPSEDLSKLMDELDLYPNTGDPNAGDPSAGAGGSGSVDGGAGGILAETDTTPTTATSRSGPGARSRIVGLVALLLGLIGSLLMLALAALVIRFGVTASDTVDRAMEPVEVAFDRLEGRIDQTDDLVDRDGIVSERIDELQARVDGMVDVSTSAHQGFEAVQDHPIYSLLPAELSTLGDQLQTFEESSVEIDRLLGTSQSGDTISPAVATGVADQLDQMQGRVSDVRDNITSAASSLRRWIRIGSFLGFLGSLWGFWGQVCLTKRGWRAFRGRRPS